MRLAELTGYPYDILSRNFKEYTKTTPDYTLDDLYYCIASVLAGTGLPFTKRMQ